MSPGPPEREPVHGPLSARVLLLTLLLIPANAWWITEIEYVRYSDNATTQAIFFNCVALLLILLGVNRLLSALRPAWRLSSAEMVALYTATALASNLAGHDQLQILFTTLTFVFRRATPENGWSGDLWPHIAPHLTLRDPEALKAIYQGNSTLYRPEHWRPWLEPLGWWTLFTTLVVWTMLCLLTLFRRQWDDERLNYPIVDIPLQLLGQTGRPNRMPLFWVGIAIGAGGQIQNLLHNLSPSIPGIPIGVQYFTAETFPWNHAGAFPISSFPFAYGLAFLLPTQLGFSCWFFMLFSRLELVGAAKLGYVEWGKFPYLQQQGVGAIFGVFCAVVWNARRRLAQIGRAALEPRSAEALDDAEEPLPYRIAAWGALGGLSGLVLFAVAAGMRVQTACLYLGILFVIVVVVTRLRAEIGLPTYELYQAGADDILLRSAGMRAFPPGDLSVMTLFFWLSRTHRQFPMQSQADALRLARRTGAPLRQMSVLILLASVLGTVAAFWAFLHVTYQVGYESANYRSPVLWAFGSDPWQKMDTWLSQPQPADRGTVGAYLFGGLFTVLLAYLRQRFVWWPFHPAGYLVAGSFGLFRLWLPICLSWLVKVIVLRYGGLPAYRRALPFFLGLVVGEFVAGFVRTVLDLSIGLYLPPSSGIGGL